MLLEELNPILLKCSFYNGYQMKGEKKTSLRRVYDYEIEYFIASEGGVQCDDLFYPTKAGDIIFRRPGTLTYAVQPVSTFLLCVDFCGNHSKAEGYIVGTEQHMHPLLSHLFINDIPVYIENKETERAAVLIQKIHEHSIYNTDTDRISIKANLFLLVNELYQITHVVDSHFSLYHGKVRNIIGYISEHFCEDLNVADLIAQSGLSKAHFHKLFKECTGLTPIQYITKLRIEKAQHLMLTSASGIAEIGVLCGYMEPTYFSYVFKKNTGVSAREFLTHFGKQAVPLAP